MPQTEDIALPKDVVDSEWRDDIDYTPYQDEGTYVSPKRVTKATINKIKSSPIKLSIRNLVDWNKVNDSVSA